MPIVRVKLRATEQAALARVARQERRSVGAQAAVIIRTELERFQMLPATVATDCASEPAEHPLAATQSGLLHLVSELTNDTK